MTAAFEHEGDDTEADITLVGDPWSRSGERPVARVKQGAEKKPDVRERLARRTTSAVVAKASVERAKAASGPVKPAPPVPRPAPEEEEKASVVALPPPVPPSATVPDVAELPDLSLLPPTLPAVLAPPIEVDVAYEEALRGMSAGPLDGVTRVVATALLFVALVVVGIVRLPFDALAVGVRFLAARWTRASAIVAGRAGR